jgi:periplasmic protein TonB
MRYKSIFAASLLAFVVSAASAGAMTEPQVDTTKPHAQPDYPDAAQLGGEEGTVDVSVLVRPSGRVAKVRVAKSSGFVDLDNAAVEGVVNWRFIPAVDGGETVSAWKTVRIVYQLPRPPAPSAPVK